VPGKPNGLGPKEKPFMCSHLGLTPSLTHKYLTTRLERLVKDRLSFLLGIFINCGCKKFYNVAPEVPLMQKLQFSHKLAGVKKAVLKT
jgi:hypothetical protein